MMIGINVTRQKVNNRKSGKHYKKKILSLLLAAAMTFSLAGCGGGDAGDAAGSVGAGAGNADAASTGGSAGAQTQGGDSAGAGGPLV